MGEKHAAVPFVDDPVIGFLNRVIRLAREVGPEYVYGTAAVTFALVIGYYLIVVRGRSRRVGPDASPSQGTS